MFDDPMTALARRVSALQADVTEMRRLQAVTHIAPTAYTPTWTGTTTNPVLNNGTLTAYYTRLGKLVVWELNVTIGAGTTLGSGGWEFTLPVAGILTTPRFVIGTCQILDNGVADYVGVSRIDANTGKIRGLVYTGTAGGGFATVGHATPHAWGAGDVLALWGAYMLT